MMDVNVLLDQFKKELKDMVPQLISEILAYRPQEKVYGIAFLTTDDFYGMYAAFETKEHLQTLLEKYQKLYPAKEKDEIIPWILWSPGEWGYSDQELPSDYNKALYGNLVAVVEADDAPDFTQQSDKKWLFAVSLINAIGEAILAVPPALFEEHGYCKDDIVFLATMSDGDYMDEMMLESAKTLNTPVARQPFLDSLDTPC